MYKKRDNPYIQRAHTISSLKSSKWNLVFNRYCDRGAVSWASQ
jgi:hypothetical protein